MWESESNPNEGEILSNFGLEPGFQLIFSHFTIYIFYVLFDWYGTKFLDSF